MHRKIGEKHQKAGIWINNQEAGVSCQKQRLGKFLQNIAMSDLQLRVA